MGHFFKILISVLFKFVSFTKQILSFKKFNKVKIDNVFLFSNYSIKGSFNTIKSSSSVEKTTLLINGDNNNIQFNSGNVYKSLITIKGNNNKIEFEAGVRLNHAVINIRGTNCVLKIGANSTFGGVRIVNVGTNNNILIGSGCLFADHIEVWASDTHSIYNEFGEFINPERPIYIGNDVWIGSHVKILKGVTIGDGSIIGMNTTVTKSSIPYSVNVGNPMKLVNKDVKWSLKYENE